MEKVIKMDGILLINKPAGYTSHDIVGIVRKKLHTKKVGHCGTWIQMRLVFLLYV